MKYVALLIVALAVAAQAQNQSAPEDAQSPAKPFVARGIPKHADDDHRFFDLPNSFGLGYSALAIMGDSHSTQTFLGLGKTKFGKPIELNPLAKPFTKSTGGQIFISSAGFGGEIGGMYLLHRLEQRAGDAHPRKRKLYLILERTLPFAVGTVEMTKWAHNKQLISKVKLSQ